MKWIFVASLLVSAATPAAELTRFQQWLSFTQGAAFNASGPAGMYAAQDMQEIRDGETLYLNPVVLPDGWKWSRTGSDQPVASVAYRNGKAMLSGRGIETLDLLERPDRQLTLPGQLTVRVSLLGAETLKVWLHNPERVMQRGFRGLDFFSYDPKGVVTARFTREEEPAAVDYLDSREHAGVMYVVGSVALPIAGRTHVVKAYSRKNRWEEIDYVLLMFKDRTSGKSTYGGGRVIEVALAKGSPLKRLAIDLNLAYSFSCAHSPFYNCPLALVDRIDATLHYGEKYPPL
ncbi:MAG TPA: DUF1684 domain-containing protein [Tahibacter sp.]|uniref:DUF1684 domain-containing protein n=1 Tax=Tahibacter sp. TaxID=2056211 RepID=UPI002CE1DB1B|nr:DUF1684 domain-containing protein [Tahibacter sp.]HSX61014.1 DUF1684 domain-containing protein [Tahibacter sp.]